MVGIAGVVSQSCDPFAATDLRGSCLPFRWPQDAIMPRDLRTIYSTSIPFECRHGISVWCECGDCEAAHDRARERGYLWTAVGLLVLDAVAAAVVMVVYC